MARKILLADDSVTAQNMGRKILTDAGYDVITVNNGSAALKRVSEQKPDLIVLDVYMPGYSGLEVCVRLKDSPETSRIPILLTVGKLEPFKPEEASRVRADAFIIKPFEASELLSALTRLEDRMVPQADGGRFSTTVSGIERFSNDPMMRKAEPAEEDSGWRSRLRFPKKKKEEPEPPPTDDEIGVTPFRDFKKNAPKPAPAGSFAVNKAAPTAQEPGLVPDIPRDITPEELDALSELVAKLDGPIPAAEDIAPIGESLGAAPSPIVEERVAEAKAVEEKPVEQTTEEPKPEVEAEIRALEVKAEDVKVEAVAESTAQVAQPDVDAAPAAHTDTSTKLSEAVAEASASGEAAGSFAASSEPSTAPQVAAQTQAPVSAHAAKTESDITAAEQESAAPEMTGGPESSPHKEADIAAVAASEPAAQADTPAVEAVTKEEVTREAATAEPLPVAEAQPVAEPSVVEASPEPEPVATTAAEIPMQPEAPEPSPEELAEALRLLTPSTAGGQTLAEAGAKLAEELARGATPGHRWVAEKVALTAEESSLSLEAEMFKSFAGQSTAASGPIDSTSTSADTPVVHEEEEAAEAAVEAAEAGAAEESQPEHEVASQAATAETHAPAEIVAEPVNAESAQAVTVSQSADAAGDEPIDEDVAAVTFADAIRSEEPETVTANSTEISNSEDPSGGQDDMAKDSKGKWHQIHSTPEPAAKTDVVEAAKQSEESPKAMAAAASEGGSSEATAIASIVDSVLADLKPKIVEEIAKKLGKK